MAELGQLGADAPDQEEPGEGREPAPARDAADDVDTVVEVEDGGDDREHLDLDDRELDDRELDDRELDDHEFDDDGLDDDYGTQLDDHLDGDGLDGHDVLDDGDDSEAGDDPDTADRPAKLSRWDRPPPPKDWRWWVGGAGKIMIATGLLLLGFVAYQLWGTGIETARAQRALESDFEQLLTIAPEVDTSETTSTADADGTSDTPPGDAGDGTGADAPAEPIDEADEPATGGGLAPGPDAADAPTLLAAGGIPPLPVENQNIPEIEGGDALARLEIPAIGVDNIVVAGVQTSDLKKGPGHFPETPLPGQLGNAAIAGHRTTYGQPFHNVDKLEWGDEIIVTTLTGRYVYLVTDKEIVSPSDYQVVTTVDPTVANLTLTSCHPKWTARERIIISSVIDYGRSDRVGEPVLFYGQPPVSDESDDDPAAAVDADETGDDAAITDASAGVSSSLLDTSTVDDQLVGVSALSSGATDAGIADAFAEGWFSDPAAWWDVALWATVLVLLCVGCYLLARHFRRTWVGVLAGVVPFLVGLYFFYQNVNRLLPPNL